MTRTPTRREIATAVVACRNGKLLTRRQVNLVRAYLRRRLQAIKGKAK